MIEVRDLRFRHPGAADETLRGVSFSIPPGGLVALMGANGSGKSTLARCLNGLLVPQAGSIRVDGFTRSDAASPAAAGGTVGLVFQNPASQVTSPTVEREIAFGLQSAGLPTDEIHARVDRTLREHGLEGLRGRSPSELSGGELQRVAVAAVMALAPRYLVLDEATSLLSAESRRAILRRMHEERARGVGILLITQFPAEALEAERLLVLDRGAVALQGAPAELFARPGLMDAAGVPVPFRARLGAAR